MSDLLLRFRDDAQLQPFMVFTAGRSRTMWLSAFLTYGICRCEFESLARVGSFSEVVRMLSIPGLGSSETMAAPAWPLLLTAAPTLRCVVVRRPVGEIVDDLVQQVGNKAALDLPRLEKTISYVDRALVKLGEQPQALTVSFKDLRSERMCAEVFEHCLPYKHDAGWWEFMNEKVLNPDVLTLGRVYQERQWAIQGLARECRHLLFRLGRQGHFEHLKEGTSYAH